jgi:hypothetical protein
MIFKSSNPQAALDKTRAKLASVESNIIELRAKRAETLLSAEDAGAVVAIDKAIEAELANAKIYQDRIKALQEECRRLEFQSREGQRAKQIEKIKERLAKREELAADLQFAIQRIGHLYTELMSSNDETESLWKFPGLGAGWARIDHRGVNREVSWLLFGLTRIQRVPEPSSAFAGVIGVQAIGIDGVVRQQNEAIISRLSTAPIHSDLLDETA